MYIETVHTIPDEKAFRSALSGPEGLPEGVWLVTALVRKDHSRVTCVWKAASVDALRAAIEARIGKVAETAYYELDEAASFGPGRATATDPTLLHEVGKKLYRLGRPHEALAVFQLNAAQNPKAWFTEVGLARGYAVTGDRDRALRTLRAALERTPPHRRERVQGLVSRLESGQNLI
jgi:tetratricopeptide (TPR) repeat protein